MKYIDEYRDPAAADRLLQAIRSAARQRWVVMEVCGGQTHGLLRYGIDRELQDQVELIHGPGCPVCVTDLAAIDASLRLAALPGVVLASFGDMLRVPGSCGSLMTARAAGASVITVYSPLDAVRYAQQHPTEQVIFFAVGFETTAPATALAVLQADRLQLRNFSVLAAHVRVQPAMEAVLQAPDNRIQAFLAAGHVCAITGYESLEQLSLRYQTPVAVTGFEPIDLLQGILECVRQLESGCAQVTNCYGRTVRRDGNLAALSIVNSVYETTDRVWRGFGTVPGGGFRLRSEFREFDAAIRFAPGLAATDGVGDEARSAAEPDRRCRAGDVLTGRLHPTECPEFRTTCTPETPLGAPMVSSEGACAACFRYRPAVSLSRNSDVP